MKSFVKIGVMFALAASVSACVGGTTTASKPPATKPPAQEVKPVQPTAEQVAATNAASQWQGAALGRGVVDARKALKEAGDKVTAATTALTAVTGATNAPAIVASISDVATARTAVDHARMDLNHALAANPRVTATVTAAQGALTAARRALELAQSLETATETRDAAQEALETAQNAWTQSETTVGILGTGGLGVDNLPTTAAMAGTFAMKVNETMALVGDAAVTADFMADTVDGSVNNVSKFSNGSYEHALTGALAVDGRIGVVDADGKVLLNGNNAARFDSANGVTGLVAAKNAINGTGGVTWVRPKNVTGGPAAGVGFGYLVDGRLTGGGEIINVDGYGEATFRSKKDARGEGTQDLIATGEGAATVTITGANIGETDTYAGTSTLTLD